MRDGLANPHPDIIHRLVNSPLDQLNRKLHVSEITSIIKSFESDHIRPYHHYQKKSGNGIVESDHTITSIIPSCQKKQFPLLQRKKYRWAPQPLGQPLSGALAVPCVCVPYHACGRAGAVPEIPIGGIQ